VLVSTYDDYYSSGSYFKDADGYPFWQAVYMPFGEVYKDFGSAGFVIGNPAGDGILWSVPFRFPGQYQDPEDELYNNIYYNRHRGITGRIRFLIILSHLFIPPIDLIT